MPKLLGEMRKLGECSDEYEEVAYQLWQYQCKEGKPGLNCLRK